MRLSQNHVVVMTSLWLWILFFVWKKVHSRVVQLDTNICCTNQTEIFRLSPAASDYFPLHLYNYYSQYRLLLLFYPIGCYGN